MEILKKWINYDHRNKALPSFHSFMFENHVFRVIQIADAFKWFWRKKSIICLHSCTVPFSLHNGNNFWLSSTFERIWNKLFLRFWYNIFVTIKKVRIENVWGYLYKYPEGYLVCSLFPFISLCYPQVLPEKTEG